MHSPTSFKQEFIKKWAMALKFCCGSSSTKKMMSFSERKKIIKLSSDIAMASARNGKTCWSRALISKASKEYENFSILTVNPSMAGSSLWCNKRVVRSKKILKSCRVRRIKKNVPPRRVRASSIAKTMVKKRTQVLKELVPGGESMDEISLLEETLDYIVSLQAQVDVMRGLVDAFNLSS
ncbi:hypothetical protein BVC80_1735g5 [Macleaya cordata]|uniref:IBH1-like N-terminal domain-containing protein n=1 Tax=Macleaya cordata TaxID=56857 RepID=A0A200Q8T4_MACCD|nr:hypothetical protein BVC80_1735g5 [Macleaya cordata]